jgi:hypothetical protein
MTDTRTMAGPLIVPAADPVVDMTADRARRGVRLWEQLKHLPSKGEALWAIAELDDEELRAIVTHQLFAWHQPTKHGDDSHSSWRRDR